jgi:H+/Cl- antiporter ClcA
VSAATEPRPVDAGAYLRLVGLGAAIGIPAALAAALFLALLHDAEGWLWHDLPDALGYDAPPWFLVLVLPAVGALLVAAARLWLPGDGGHSPREGLEGAPTPPRHVPGVLVAALGTLVFGAVLGPELPVVALGSAIGLALALVTRLDERESGVLATAGSASAISALFGGPLVAGILLVESGLAMGAALLPVLLPCLVAAAVGYLVFIGFGDWSGLEAPGLVVPDLPPYEGVHAYELSVAVAVGVLAAFTVLAVRIVSDRVALEERLGMPGLLVGGGLAVGALAVLGGALGADSQDVLFSGQASVPAVISEDSASVIAVLIACKFLAYAVSLGCGFRGGAIFPAIFLGIALASLAVVWFDVSATLAVAVGAAAGMAAQTKLLISPLVFATLLVGGQNLDVVPAAVLATAAAWIVVHAVPDRARAEQHG